MIFRFYSFIIFEGTPILSFLTMSRNAKNGSSSSIVCIFDRFWMNPLGFINTQLSSVSPLSWFPPLLFFSCRRLLDGWLEMWNDLEHWVPKIDWTKSANCFMTGSSWIAKRSIWERLRSVTSLNHANRLLSTKIFVSLALPSLLCISFAFYV